MTLLAALAVVCGMVGGQLLFKIGADLFTRHQGSILSPAGAVLGCALALYGLTTLGWIWVLQRSELGKIYPLMALSFVLVPLASHFVLGEQFSWRYGLGCAFIVAGIALAARG